jgi:hypothetical protein
VQLFGEGPSTVLVSTTDADALVAAARAAEVPAFVLGLTGGARLVLRDAGNQVLIDAPVDGLREVWSQGFEAVLK